MKVVLLAGGRGTRLSEETSLRPKPMVEIGGKPLLWHIMHGYARRGFNEFIVACGYKGEIIRDYFARPAETGWRVECVDTGLDVMTGGRLRRLRDRLSSGPFMVTYGDGVSDVDASALLAFHKKNGKLATVTAVRPPARFGGLELDGETVKRFTEKPQTGEGWINGGFFVLEPEALGYLGEDDACIFERAPLERLAEDGQLMAYRHEGFWQPVDTLRDKELLEARWANGDAPWKTW